MMEDGQADLIEWGQPKETVLWPDNLYQGVLVKIEDIEGQYGKMWRLFFEVKKDKDTATFAYSIGTKPTKNNRAGNCLLALGFKEGSPIVKSQLIGKKATLLIQSKILSYNGEEVKKSVIDRVMEAKPE